MENEQGFDFDSDALNRIWNPIAGDIVVCDDCHQEYILRYEFTDSYDKGVIERLESGLFCVCTNCEYNRGRELLKAVGLDDSESDLLENDFDPWDDSDDSDGGVASPL